MIDIQNEMILDIVQDIEKNGGKCFIVGGAVRDYLLGKESDDLDIEIFGIEKDNLKNILCKYGKVKECGQVYGVFKLDVVDADFSLAREDVKIAQGHKGFLTNFSPSLKLKKACMRRDFTMNSILYDISEEKLIDFFNGENDIHNKKIKHTNIETFSDDPLRPLRAARFASQLNFYIDRNTISISKKIDYSQLSAERVKLEIDKILLSDTPSIGIEYLKEMNILNVWMPELLQLEKCNQNSEYHMEGSVWNHTMLVVDEAAKINKNSDLNYPLGFMYSALLHDIGKPDTVSIGKDKKIHHFKHEIEGEKISIKILNRLNSDNKLLKYVSSLVRNHMKFHKIENMRKKTIQDLMLTTDMESLLLLGYADSAGRKTKDTTKAIKRYIYAMEIVGYLSNGGFGKIEPYLQGKDLLEIGFAPGKNIGKELNILFALQLEGKSKEEIEKVAKKRFMRGNHEL